MRSIISALATIVAAGSITLAGHPLAGAAVEVKQIPVVQFHAMTEVAAPAPAVWAFMTRGKNFVTWCPEWKNPKNVAINLVKVGDSVDLTDQWGNNGRSIVTYLVRNHELRVAHEPNKGDFLCQAKMILTPSASGTASPLVARLLASNG